MNRRIDLEPRMTVPPLDPSRANLLATRMQRSFPLVSEPFARLAAELEVTPEAVLAQLRRWRDQGLLREISAVLEGEALGYDSALVAGRVPRDRLDEVARIVGAHPTVTHNYERGHDYNLWFTIASPHEMPLETQLDMLARECEVERFQPLRRTHTLKIGVVFDLETRANSTAPVVLPRISQFAPTRREIAMFRALQRPLPLTANPFAVLAADAGVGEDDLLRLAHAQMGNAVRKYVATFQHRRLGVGGNGMSVWNVAEDRIEELGARMATYPVVSHCYARNAIAGFPYRLYAMLHLPDHERCQAAAATIAAELGLADYALLFGLHEYKKCRLRYFLPELDDWWTKHGGTAGAVSR